MLMRLISGYSSVSELLAYAIASLAVIFFILPLHECAHGFVAYRLGDSTAKRQGRLTLNPFAHVDWMGAALTVLFGFGWARPVPVNQFNLRHPKRDMALVALAGPVTNLIAALAAVLLDAFTFLIYIKLGMPWWLYTALRQIFGFFAATNVSLAVFNFIPIPPLDGSRILSAFLPSRIYYKLMRYERYSFIILMVLCASGAFSNVTSSVTGSILELLYSLANNILRVFW